MSTEDYNTIRELHDRLSAATRDSFKGLTGYVGGLDPIKLLSQLTLTFLRVPESMFVAESDDTVKWARWIEFVAGLLLSKEYPRNPEQNIDGRHLEEVERLLDSYFGNISAYTATTVSDDEKDRKMETVVGSARTHSLYVRGETYPHQLLELSKELYSEHDEWFRRQLGFTIGEAISISESIKHECNRRINEENKPARNRAKEYVGELIDRNEASEEDRDDLETRAYCYFYFGHADSILSFSLDQLVKFSRLPQEICEKYLARLSQPFGYTNPNFQDVFRDPFSAPWDYNTLYERPIVSHNERYLVPVPSLFPTVLFHTFYYDLLADTSYSPTWERKYGAWLERKTADCFAKVFPSEGILLNPKYPDGNELTDVLILHDRKIFIVGCKTKKLRYESQIGRSFDALKQDLEKGVKESFEQALKAREYINSSTQPEIRTDYGSLVVDTKQVSDIFLVSVTLGSYQNLTTRLANINPSLELFSHNQYPWAVSLFDLMVVTELMDYPSMFIHYAKRRLEVERTNFDLLADEIDLLGFYFKQGLVFDIGDFKGADFVGLNGYSLEPIPKSLKDRP